MNEFSNGTSSTINNIITTTPTATKLLPFSLPRVEKEQLSCQHQTQQEARCERKFLGVTVTKENNKSSSTTNNNNSTTIKTYISRRDEGKYLLVKSFITAVLTTVAIVEEDQIQSRPAAEERSFSSSTHSSSAFSDISSATLLSLTVAILAIVSLLPAPGLLLSLSSSVPASSQSESPQLSKKRKTLLGDEQPKEEKETGLTGNQSDSNNNQCPFLGKSNSKRTRSSATAAVAATTTTSHTNQSSNSLISSLLLPTIAVLIGRRIKESAETPANSSLHSKNISISTEPLSCPLSPANQTRREKTGTSPKSTCTQAVLFSRNKGNDFYQHITTTATIKNTKDDCLVSDHQETDNYQGKVELCS